MIGNELNTLMTLMSKATTTAGRSSGNVIEKYVRHVDAPSTRAASYTSGGMVCRPARIAYVVNGNDTNTATTIIQTKAAVGRPSQSAWSEPSLCRTPTSCRNTLMTPLFGSSAHRKTSAVIITDAAHGAIRAQRATRRPGKRSLNSWARTSDSTVVTATTHTTQTIVRMSTAPSAGSLNRSE